MSNALQSLLLKASQLIAEATGKTGGAGAGGGAGLGLGGPFPIAAGFAFSGSTQVLTDQTGTSAYAINFSLTIPSFTKTIPQSDPLGRGGFGAAANVGFQGSVNTQTIEQMLAHQSVNDITSSNFGGSAAYGPVGLDANQSGGTVTLGPGVGSRFAGGPTFSVSHVIPVCKE